MPPVCISVINMKGGVGKTTVTALLARFAATPSHNLKVLAIDLDPQANLSQALMGRDGYSRFQSSKSASIVELFKGYQPPTSSMPSPASLNVNNVAQDINPRLSIIPSRFDFADNLVSAVKPDPQRLAAFIADNFQDKDLVLIDCAPTESIFTQAAYHASRYILVPVRPEFFATIGFPLLNDSLGTFKGNNMGNQIDVMGVVINNATYEGNNEGGPERRRALEEIIQEADENGWYMFKNEITYSRGFPKVMRGDFSHPGNSLNSFARFAREFFGRPELGGLRSWGCVEGDSS